MTRSALPLVLQKKLLSTGGITFAFKVRAHDQYEAVIA